MSPRRALARALLLATIAAPGIAALSPAARAEPATAPEAARIYLTWNAPYGQPRASESLSAPCGDTTRVDTLWMCFDPGKASAGYVGMTSTVSLWPADGDTLGPHWDFGHGQAVKRLRIEFNPDSVRGTKRAWHDGGIGRFGYFRGPTSGSIRLIQAVGTRDAIPVEPGGVYALARVLVPRPSKESDACAHPVCIEWQWATMAYGEGDEPQVHHGARFVSWNAPRGKDACGTMRQAGAPRSWRPGQAPTPAPRDSARH